MDSRDDGNIDSGHSSTDDKMSNLLDRDYTQYESEDEDRKH